MKRFIPVLLLLLINALISSAQTPELLLPQNAQALAVSNNMLYFISNYNLYKSDGTAENTEQVKEINELSTHVQFTEYDGKTYFKGPDNNNGDELWVTDGTNAGTIMLAEINSDGDGCLNILGVFNDKLYFMGDDGTHGRELWVTDGTESGTQLFLDINEGIEDGISYSTRIIILNNELFFQANDGIQGSELWKTDGSAANTQMLIDINSTSDSDPSGFTIANGKLYFTAYNELGEELWVTDGTNQGTHIVIDINPGSDSSTPFKITPYNGKVYFITSMFYDYEAPYNLWESDGTEVGTQIFQDSASAPFVYNNQLYFGKVSGFTAAFYEYAVYKSDGTSQGTTLLTELNGGNSKDDPRSFTIADGKLYFLCNYDGDGGANYLNNDLWVTDGTPANTNLVRYSDQEIVNVYQISSKMTVLNSSLFFASQENLYKINGTELSFGNNINSDLNISLFPNPAQSQLFINSLSTVQSVEIYSALGTLAQIEKSNTFSIQDLEAGIYFIRIKTKDGTGIERFIKQ
jgi:ELWxxDGT repeat protein